MADTYLSVVDSDDQIIGRQLRSIIHAQGLRHREVHVWFITKKHELVFQRRGKTKDTFPNMLGATVGGHVEEGQDYITAALAEVREETGVELMKFNLHPLAKVDIRQVDAARGATNVVYRMVYLYKFAGKIEDLTIEAGDGGGFELVPLADVIMKRGDRIAQMTPGLLSDGYLPVWQAIRDVLHI